MEMSTYNFSNIKMNNSDEYRADNSCLSPLNASPPDFDFNIPCRFFKSSFARSLSLNNSNNSNNSNQCKSLDYDMRSTNNNNDNKLSCLKAETVTVVSTVPPLPQKRTTQAGSCYQQQNEANTCKQKHVLADAGAVAADVQEKPPTLPARCPVSLHNFTLSVNECQMENEEPKLQQTMLTQLRQQKAYKQATNSSNNLMLMANGNNSNTNSNSNNNCNNNTGMQTTLNQKLESHHQLTSSMQNNVVIGNNNNNSNSSCNINNNNKNISKRNNNSNQFVWPNQQQNMEQDSNIYNFAQAAIDINDDELNSNFNDTVKLSGINDYNKHFHMSNQMLHMTSNINIPSNQQKQPQQQQNQKLHHHHQQQQQQQQQHHHHHQQQQQLQKQQQQHHHMPSFEILDDNTTNVEAVILQNQVDTLQWQLKRVETSCDMYRAVMEEVARFLERYQSQKQLQQQQQQQLQQQLLTQKHYKTNTNTNNINNNNNNKMEQIPRSKSLFQVYISGGNEKSGKKNLDDTTRSLASATSASYLRARSSTNLIDLKAQQLNGHGKQRKDEHIFQADLTPSQSYSAFKDFTWRRSPKKFDSRLSLNKDDVEEKLNQEAFRLLRTIQNLINTSQHQPDLANQRHSLAPVTTLQMGRLSKAISTTSVMTLPGPPLLNSTSLTMSANSAGSTTPDSATDAPTLATANNTASNNNLAPEMIFLRSANMRDSRLSLRSSTDSSVHSTSSVASSASSKVETDEEPSTQFNSPPNIPTHKQHHNLAGSSTEDESGFSSISSFPDIGVPLSSTILSSTPSKNKTRLIGKELKSVIVDERDLQTPDSRNSTLKANVVGLPLNSSQDMSHRWDSPSKTYHNASNKFQLFSSFTNEDSNAVLWV